MAKLTLRQKVKKLSHPELLRQLDHTEHLNAELHFEYYRRKAQEIKKHDPEYYESHFKKIYG